MDLYDSGFDDGLNESKRSFLFKLILYVAERIGALSAEVEALQTAVQNLESDDEQLKLQVAASVVELKNLETKVQELEQSGSLTPEQAKELTDKINTVAVGMAQSTEALKNA